MKGNWISRNKHLVFFLITSVSGLIFFLAPSLADQVYRRFIFQIFRMTWDYTLGFIPVPKIFLILIVILVLLISVIRKHRKDMKSMARSVLAFFNVVLIAFLWMWGFNYFCPPLLHQSSEPAMSDNDYYTLGLGTAKHCKEILPQIKPESITVYDYSEEAVRDAVSSFLSSQGWPVLGIARCDMLNEFGLIRKFGIAGIYIPFAGEAYSSETFNDISKPFIMAHEMAHAYGVTGEGEADFVAYMALHLDKSIYSDYFHYSAEIELLLSIRRHLRSRNNSLREMLIESTDDRINSDIEIIRLNNLEYPEFLPGMGNQLNNSYLKIVGIEDGVRNYDKFVEMVWRERLK